MIQFNCDNIPMPDIDIRKTEQWIKVVAAHYGFAVGELNYIFCDDEKILAVNREFLQHDYFTDVITFDYSTRTRVNGDIFISLETVQTNADANHTTFIHELYRIIIHGLLHLTGQADKTPETKEQMTAKEEDALKNSPLNSKL